MDFDSNEGVPMERPPGGSSGAFARYALSAVAVCLLVPIVGFAWVWGWWRIPVDKGQFVALMKKTGPNITNETILATPEFKGSQFEILREGRHFKNPYYWWSTRATEATVISSGQVGIVVRKYGKPLPAGMVIAGEEDQKGILAEALMPGRHYINTWAFDVKIIDMVKIEPGHNGVITKLVGTMPHDPNVFVVESNERGTQPDLVGPGTHPEYSNSFVYRVTPFDTRFQKFEMAGKDSVTFLSVDGFDIKVEGTIEWAPDKTRLPELFVKYVDRKDLEKSGGLDSVVYKYVLQVARSLLRIEGGRHKAVDYLTGDTRIAVQNEVERTLRKQCEMEGIVIRSFVIRSTELPVKIRQQYERREMARRLADRFQKEVETEIGVVVLVDGQPKIGDDGKPERAGGRLRKILQERQKNRENLMGASRAIAAENIRAAEQYSKVEITKAQKMVAVAKINLEAAEDLAEAARQKGFAEADVILMHNNAQAEGVRAKVSAFGSGEKYAEYLLSIKLSPAVKRILSNTQGTFADLFNRFTGETPKDAK